jgi:hypothetical protein
MPTKGIEFQYTATVTPFVFISAIFGLKRIMDFFQARLNKKTAVYFSLVILISCFFSFMSKSNIFLVKDWKITDHHNHIDRIIAQIPTEASLTADSFLRTHAAHRIKLFEPPDSINTVDFILHDFYAPYTKIQIDSSYQLLSVPTVNPTILQVLNNKDYGIAQYYDGVTLFKKGFDYEQGLRNLAIASDEELESIPKSEQKITDDMVLIGWKGPTIKGKYDTIIQLTLYWRGLKKIADDYQFSYKTTIKNERIHTDNHPVFGLYGTHRWDTDSVIRDIILIQTSDVIKPDEYCEISIIVKDSQNETVSKTDINPVIKSKMRK